MLRISFKIVKFGSAEILPCSISTTALSISMSGHKWDIIWCMWWVELDIRLGKNWRTLQISNWLSPLFNSHIHSNGNILKFRMNPRIWSLISHIILYRDVWLVDFQQINETSFVWPLVMFGRLPPSNYWNIAMEQ